jgi:hypothetical protein
MRAFDWLGERFSYFYKATWDCKTTVPRG